MHEKAKQFGICYMEKPPYEVLYTNWLSYDQMLELKKIEEMVELYYNSNQFVYTMNYLQYQFNSPFSLYETLASFYEKQGYFINQPARAYRYQVLLEFVEEIDLENVAVYKELLTFDIYLREKVKSRPSFATELSDFKNNIREFYKEEELGRNYLPAYSNYDARQLSKMTHLEPFSYSVWEKDLSKFQKQIDKLQFVLFDYQERNPLTNEARTEII